jgi:hypothetical protein
MGQAIGALRHQVSKSAQHGVEWRYTEKPHETEDERCTCRTYGEAIPNTQSLWNYPT